MLTGRNIDSDGALKLCVIDHGVESAVLMQTAGMMATTLARSPGYTRVKAQLRAPALERMRAVIDKGDDPMLREWI